MHIKDALTQTAIPRNEVEILLAHLLQKNRAWLMSHSDELLSDEVFVALQSQIERRLTFEPIAYITGVKEFYGREFLVTPDVLIPRPATETLINAVGDFLNHTEQGEVEADTEIVIKSTRFSDADPALIVDVGTGSGCIGITLALEHPQLDIIITDNSTSALTVARKNIAKFALQDRIQVREGSLLEPIGDVSVPFLVVSNPPYIPNNEKLMPDVEKYEPHSALFGGADGSDLVLELYEQAKKNPHCVGICMECRNDHAILFT